MHIFNTLIGRKEIFKPVREGKVRMYVCGPTVYDYGHLGHGRSAVSFDVIRKYFIMKGFNVTYVTNYTDIDDKMINRAQIMNISVKELADKIIPEYERDYAALGILKADYNPKATNYMAEIIDIIKRLEEEGYVYVISDGVYFDIKRFDEYGKLSKQDIEELKSGSRVELKTEKRNPQDFVLWKFAKPDEPKWDSPWGEGRPGWHIECSAMSHAILGQTLDIHGGGADLTFPHHECEIAQSECAFNVPFVKYWMHNGFIRVNNDKMSKSLNNFFTLRDIFKEYKPQAVRYLFLQTHYRSPIDFSKDLLEQAENSLQRVHDFFRRLGSFSSFDEADETGHGVQFIDECMQKFIESMDDDFETPSALAACFEFIKELNKYMDSGSLDKATHKKALNFIQETDAVLGIFKRDVKEEVNDDVQSLINEREKARRNKDFSKSDEIRNELQKKGVQLEDTPEGTIWKRIH